MSYSPQLSLIICTRNRAASLKRALAAIRADDMIEAQAELVLVNNASTDATGAVIRAFQATADFPVSVVMEPRPGLGLARNSGLEQARGDILVFTDDDCYLQAGYLPRVVAVFADGRFQYCGGRILLHDPTDAMIAVDYRETFRLIKPRSFVPAGEIQGASMIIRRAVFDAVGGFDAELGAGREFRCEDAEFVARASMHGYTGAHVPELVVYHHHGRKASDLSEYRTANNFARGAYYAIMLGHGQWKYLAGGLLRCLVPRPSSIRQFGYFNRLRHELHGAWRYLQANRRVAVSATGRPA
jgi:glycosyltransferase involved in cell wall biosynthesis